MKACRPPRRIDFRSVVWRRSSEKFFGSKREQKISVSVSWDLELGLNAGRMREPRLNEGVVDVVPHVVVHQEALRLVVELGPGCREMLFQTAEWVAS